MRAKPRPVWTTDQQRFVTPLLSRHGGWHHHQKTDYRTHHCWLWLHVQQSTLLTTPNHTHQWWVIKAWNAIKIEVEEGKSDQDCIEKKQIFLLKIIHIEIITQMWFVNMLSIMNFRQRRTELLLHCRCHPSLRESSASKGNTLISVFLFLVLTHTFPPWYCTVCVVCILGSIWGQGGVGVKWSHHWVMKLFLFQASNYSHQ